MPVWYTIRSKKRTNSQPELPWTNTAEVQAGEPIVDEQAQGGMVAWRLFERTLTYDLVEFHDATMSSWRQEEADEVPPDELFQYGGFLDTGLRAAPAAPSPLDDTLFINRIPASGQKGKLNLRGCISEEDLQLYQRKRVMKPIALAAYGTMVTNAWQDLEENLANFGLKLGMVAHPRIGWEEVPTPPGAKPKFKPVYDKTVVYGRLVTKLRLRGTIPLQLKQH